MSTKNRVLITVIVIIFIAIVMVVCLSHKKWLGAEGWSGGYDDGSYLNGIEGYELECSKDVRIEYSYTISSGQIELKITNDKEGTDVIKRLLITESVSDVITFDNETPVTYYFFETAEEGTKASVTVEILQRKSNWARFMEERQGAKELEEFKRKHNIKE